MNYDQITKKASFIVTHYFFTDGKLKKNTLKKLNWCFKNNYRDAIVIST